MKKAFILALLCIVINQVKAQYNTEVTTSPSTLLYIYLGSLPQSSGGNLHKLKVDVLGGAWESFSTGETTFYISNRNSLKIDQTTMGSTNAGRYALHAYTNASNGMDFYLLTNNYTAIAVKSCMLGGNATQLITNTYSANAPSGVTEITPLTINPILITNELGNIGINTIGPIDKFDIAGSTGGYPGHVVFGDGNVYAPYMKFFKWAGGGNTYLQTTIANSLDVNGGFSFQTGSGGNVIGGDAQTTRMVITQPGNVGIGTIAPGLKFHTDGATGFPASSGTTQTGVIRLGVTGGYGSVLDFGSNGVLGQGWIQSTDRSNLALNYDLLLNPNGGNVGIGTTTAGAKMDIHGAGANILLGVDSYIRSSPNLNDNGAAFPLQIGPTKDVQTPRYLQFGQWADANTFEPKMVINGNSGNVGIGTSTPSSALDVGGVIQISSINQSTPPAGLNYGLFPYGGVGLGIFSGATDPNYQGIGFWTNPNGNKTEVLRINATGNVGIGTTDPQGYKLAVNGNAIANSMTVKLYPWHDYVFEKDYTLMPLADLKNYIDKNHHLPEIPSAAEIKKDGLNLGEMNGLLVKKVEELTLYLIEKEKEIRELKASQEERLKKMEQRLELLEKQ
jgi:hypothetical protein